MVRTRRSPGCAALLLGASMLPSCHGAGAPVPRAGPGPCAPAGAWTAAAPLREARYLPSAVLLSDGRVLVSGGFDRAASATPYEAMSSTEVYDPVKNTWTLVGPMNERRAGHRLLLLRDGRVLAAGGANGAAEVFDPASGAWSVVSARSPGRVGATVVAMPDGRVAVVGGDVVLKGPPPLTEYYESTTSTELYNPVTGVWSEGPRMGKSRNLGAGAATDDGTILVVGGNYYEAPLFRWELFGDRPGPVVRQTPGIEWLAPGATEWRRTRWPKGWGGTGAAAVSLSAHEVLILAGNGEGLGNRSAAVFDTRTGKWNETASMRMARSNAVLVRWKDECVVAIGGAGPSDPAEVYSADHRTWQDLPAPPNAGASVALRLPGDEILALGDHDRPLEAYRFRGSGAGP